MLCVRHKEWPKFRIAASRTLSFVSMRSLMYAKLEDVTIGNKWGIKILLYKSNLFANNTDAGLAPLRLLFELLIIRCTNGMLFA